MSITGSLNNALTGLRAVSRAAEVVSSNVSNALTEGYGRREIQLSAQTYAGNGAGVRVDGVIRHADPQIISERRLGESALAGDTLREKFHDQLARAIGQPGDARSLTGLMSGFESALIQAASAPESDTRLQAAVGAAGDVAAHLNAATKDVQSARMEADRAIAVQVEQLNSGLRNVATLNTDIQKALASGHDATALMDQRQIAVDAIARIVPVKEMPRPNGGLALYTTGGAILLETRPVEIGFTPVGVITADMTLGSGALSGLTINGDAVNTGPGRNPLGGGALGALFDIRDDLAPTAQSRLDAVARDLITRFESPAIDPTRAPGSTGLFTDRGNPLNPADETGLAGRIAIHAAVDPQAGGQAWRLRAGLGAATHGDVGDASLLNAMRDALGAGQIPASGGFSLIARSAQGLASDLLSLTSGEQIAAQRDRAGSTARVDTFLALELRNGVDTDHELQNLLLIEQAYAANARVIIAIDELMQHLLRI